MAGNTGIGKMHMELYTNNAPLTQKAKFWCNYVSSLKGEHPPPTRSSYQSWITRWKKWEKSVGRTHVPEKKRPWTVARWEEGGLHACCFFSSTK